MFRGSIFSATRWRILILIFGASCLPSASPRAQVTGGTAPRADAFNLSSVFRPDGDDSVGDSTTELSRRARLTSSSRSPTLHAGATSRVERLKLRCAFGEGRTRDFDRLAPVIRPSGSVSTQRYSGEYRVAAGRSEAYSRRRNNVGTSPESFGGGTWS